MSQGTPRTLYVVDCIEYFSVIRISQELFHRYLHLDASIMDIAARRFVNNTRSREISRLIESDPTGVARALEDERIKASTLPDHEPIAKQLNYAGSRR